MRVARIVLGMSMLVAASVCGASKGIDPPSSHRTAAVLADGALYAPVLSPLVEDGVFSPNAMPYARDVALRTSLGAMSFLPPQNPAFILRSNSVLSSFGDRRAARGDDGYNPARTPLQAVRTMEDHLLTGFIAVMLIAYQLRRKHRFLRPHQFST